LELLRGHKLKEHATANVTPDAGIARLTGSVAEHMRKEVHDAVGSPNQATGWKMLPTPGLDAIDRLWTTTPVPGRRHH
jgi:hypothetical protein